MSIMEQLKYLLELQIKQNNEEIFINQAKYVKELLKRFVIGNSKIKKKSTLISTIIRRDKNEKSKEINIKMHRGMIRSYFI